NSSTGEIVRRNNIVDTDDTQTLSNKTLSTTNNTIQIGSTNITSLLGQDVRSSATPTFVGIEMPNSVADRKIVLYPRTGGGQMFYGFGIGSNLLRIQLDQTITDAGFFAATAADASNEVFRVKGTGGV